MPPLASLRMKSVVLMRTILMIIPRSVRANGSPSTSRPWLWNSTTMSSFHLNHLYSDWLLSTTYNTLAERLFLFCWIFGTGRIPTARVVTQKKKNCTGKMCGGLS